MLHGIPQRVETGTLIYCSQESKFKVFVTIKFASLFLGLNFIELFTQVCKHTA